MQYPCAVEGHGQRKLLKNLSPLTHKTDECELKKVEWSFAGVLVSDLSLSLLNMVYADLREEYGMSQRGFHKLNAVMSQVMDLAVKEHLTEHNPCRATWVEKWRVTISSVAELLEIQRGAGAPIAIDGSRLTVMARGT
ncbi:MAG: hypothetical protein ACOX4F_09795 [Atopobiaceae bacterium]